MRNILSRTCNLFEAKRHKIVEYLTLVTLNNDIRFAESFVFSLCVKVVYNTGREVVAGGRT